MEQTKGYLRVKGKIWSLNNKEAKEFDSIKSLSFGIQTSKDNSLFLQVGEWKNTKLNVKIKAEGMTEVEEINEQEAINVIKELFKDGDSVYVNMRAEVDTYRKTIKYLVNQIYIEKEPIDFESETFEEVNELSQSVIIIEKSVNKTVKVGITTYREEMVEQDLKLTDDDINDYFEENVKVGDVMKLSISVNRKPNYVDGEDETERKTLKGKTVKTGRRNIDGYIESLEVTDVDLQKTEKKKYEKSEIREALEKTEAIATKRATSSEHKASDTLKDSDLPF
jgi:hypothetical protein